MCKHKKYFSSDICHNFELRAADLELTCFAGVVPYRAVPCRAYC